MENNYEIDITEFFKKANPAYYSASAMELGQDAGKITWQNAVDASDQWNFLDNEEKRENFRNWVESSGGWSEEEIRAWSDIELNALFIQWVSGDIREMKVSLDWDDYEELQQQGTVSSNLFRTDEGKIYFCISN